MAVQHDTNIIIARNTVFLYARTVLALLIGLWTSRLVLGGLGADGYGIFSVTAGFISFFTFLNAAAGAASLRFFARERASGNPSTLRDTFACALRLHLITGLAALAVAETAGLYIVENVLEFAPEHAASARMAYQAAVLSAVCAIVELPYIAALMAAERMGIYAGIALAQAVLKLAAAASLSAIEPSTRLISYALLFGIANIATCILWISIARSRLAECRTMPRGDRRLTKEMLAFTGWDCCNNFCSAARLQGVYILFNRFGGVVVNAAAGIAMQISSAMTQLGDAIVLAFRPRIVCSHAEGSYGEAAGLVCRASRYALLLTGAVAVPLLLDTDYILTLWLGQAPAHTAAFARLCVASAMAQTAVFAVMAGIHATGRIRNASLASGALQLAELPLALLLLKTSGNHAAVFALHVVTLIIILCVCSAMLSARMPAFSWLRYMVGSVGAPLLVFGTAMAASSLLLSAESSFSRLCAMTASSAVITAAATYTFMLGKNERTALRLLAMPRKNLSTIRTD